MSDWHPTMADADPDGAWYSDEDLERQHQAEAADREFRAVIARRLRFEQMVSERPDYYSTPERLRQAWEAARAEDEAPVETRSAVTVSSGSDWYRATQRGGKRRLQ